jgi:hypothetical protein
MSIALVSQASSSGDNTTDATTASFNSTGANLIVVTFLYSPVGTPSIIDSKGNTYTLLTAEQTLTTATEVRIAYCESPIVGTGHTVTVDFPDFSGSYPVVIARAYSGAGEFDQESAGGGGGGSPIQPGSLTPSEDNCLLVAAWAHEGTTSANAIGSSFTNLTKVNKATPNNELLSADKIQTSAGAENPSISWTTGAWSAATMACFKSDGGGADITAPTVVSVTVQTDGVTTAVVFDEDVVVANANGITYTPSGGASTLAYSSGSGSQTVLFTNSRTIDGEETLTFAYSSTTGDIEDSAGNDLATFAAIDVVNMSVQEPSGLGPEPVPPDMFTVPYSLPTGGTTYTPADSAAFTTALAAAVGGDVIVLTAGVTYTGNFKLRNWGAGTDWIYIISSALASLDEDERVGLGDIANMPTITVATNAPIHSDAAAHHYRLAGLRVITGAADRLVTVQLGYNGDYTTVPTTDANQPHHITIDRCVIGSTSDSHKLRHGVLLNGNYMAVVNSYIYNCKDTEDAQAIFIWNGGHHYLIDNNYCEASAENIIVGGTDPYIPNAVPSDIQVTRNYLYKPVAWKAPDLWGFKNLFELKNCRRVLVSGNVMENNWADAQVGFAVLFTVRNQSDTAPWSVVKDVDFTNNIIINSGSLFSLTGGDDNYDSQTTRRIRIHNNLGDITDDYSLSPTFIQAGTVDGQPIQDLTVTHNTFWAPADETGPVNHINFPTSNTIVDGFILQDNIMVHGEYNPTWARTTSSTHDHNVLVMIAANSRYAFNKSEFATQHPGDFMSDPELDSVGFTDWENGNWRLTALSTFKGDGTLGSDPGIDQDELEEETAGAISGEWDDPTPTPGTQRGPAFSPVLPASFSPTNVPLALNGG